MLVRGTSMEERGPARLTDCRTREGRLVSSSELEMARIVAPTLRDHRVVSVRVIICDINVLAAWVVQATGDVFCLV